MSGRLATVVELVRQGALAELGARARVWLRRRYYRALARFQAIGADLEMEGPPQTLVAGCVYKIPVRVRNRSRIVWNSAQRSPRFCAALSLQLPDGSMIEGRHRPVPGSLKPGDTAVMDLLLDVPLLACTATLRLDLVREACYWFSEIGHPPREMTVRLATHDDALLQAYPVCLDVTADITNRCPLRCIQCRKTVDEETQNQGEMDPGLYKRIAADVMPRAQSVMLSSAGEPMMAGYLLDALDTARGHGVVDLGFCTSGLLLDRRRAAWLVEKGIDRIEFSLDGATPETYNAIRVRSDFDAVVENIARLSHLKAASGRRHPLIRLNYVMMRRNIHELPDFVDLAARLGAEEVQCQHLVAFSAALRDEALVFDKLRANVLIRSARERARLRGVRFYHPPLFSEGPDAEEDGRSADHLASPTAPLCVDGGIWQAEGAQEESFARKPHSRALEGMPACTDPWRKVYLDWQGLVFPCCVWKEDPLGDLRRSSFDEIWHSAGYRRLRRELLVGPLRTSCAECSAITGGDVDDERSYVSLRPDPGSGS